MLLLLLSFVALDAAAVVACCCYCRLLLQMLLQQAALASQPRLFGASYNSFLSFLRQANQNFRHTYLENLFQIKTWKIILSIQDNCGNFNYGLL
jgi:hypothetical protein